MEMTPEMIALSTELATIAGRKSVEAIFDKIRTVKQTGNKEQIINNLEEIINELIADKNSLIQISQAYEENLCAQKITEEEIEYITNSVIPLLETFIAQDDDGKIQAALDILKPLLSKEMFNIMQILGFNFKKAIGEPLTELLASYIRGNINKSTNDEIYLQRLESEKQFELIKLCQDKDAFERLAVLIQAENSRESIL